MVARRLSHRVVAIGHFPPSSDSWHPTHSTHKFTRATAWGGAIPGVRSSDGWLLAHSRESAVALSIIIVHCRQTRGNIEANAPRCPSTRAPLSKDLTECLSEPRVPGNLLSEHRYRNIRRNACPSHMSAIQTLSRANDPSWRPRSAPFAMPERILAAPRGPGD